MNKTYFYLLYVWLIGHLYMYKTVWRKYEDCHKCYECFLLVLNSFNIISKIIPLRFTLLKFKFEFLFRCIYF